MKSIPSLGVERMKIRHYDFDATLRIRLCPEIYGGFWWSTWNLIGQHLHDVAAVSQEGVRRSYWTVKGLCPCSRRSMTKHWLETRTIIWWPRTAKCTEGEKPPLPPSIPTSKTAPTLHYLSTSPRQLHTTHHQGYVLSSLIPKQALFSFQRKLRSRSTKGSSRRAEANWRLSRVLLSVLYEMVRILLQTNCIFYHWNFSMF